MTRKPITDHEIIDDALNLDGSPEAIKRFYDRWAQSYDSDLADLGYAGPGIMTALLDKHSQVLDGDRGALAILDAGCGTGLIGAELHRLGYPNVDGFDLSPEMARHAQAGGHYRKALGDIDIMTADDTFGTDRYDAVLCAGVFTLGHVAPDALNSLLRLARPGGLLLVSTRSQYYQETDYRKVSGTLIDTGHMALVEAMMDAGYLDGSTSHFWVYRKAPGPST